MMLPLALASLARQQLNWHTTRLLHHTSSRSFRSFCFAPAKHVLLQSSGNGTARSTLKSPLYFAPTVHYRILALFATKSSATPTTTEQSPSSRPKSVWKSSAKALEGEVEDGASAYREKLYRQLSHEKDLSGVVKEETVLYTLTGTTLYRVFFVLIIAQFFFWVICANILYMFYAGIDSDGNKLRDLYKGEKEDKGKEASFLQTCWDNFSGKWSQVLFQGFFFSVGTICAVVFMYLLSRCVSFIHLMPGGKQVKLGHLNVFGGASAQRYKLINLEDLSSVEHRLQRVNYISLHIRDKYGMYLIDKAGGRFKNEQLYDQTVGVQRNLSLKAKSRGDL